MNNNIINFPLFKYFNSFLDSKYYEELEKHVYSNEVSWHWSKYTLHKKFYNVNNVKAEDDSFLFGRLIFHEEGDLEIDEIWKPLIESIENQFKSKLHRFKLNLYTNQNTKIITTSHHDICLPTINKEPDPKYEIIILNFTDCNGGTKIGNLEVASRRNGAVHFENIHKHSGIVQTDVERRICANIVIYPKE
jgi:hypothetical protein